MSRLSAPLTVALWGCANLALFLILVGFGEGAAPMALYGGAVAFVFLIALGVRSAVRRRPAQPSAQTWRRARNGDSVLILAAAILMAGLAWVFYWELTPVAAAPLLLALRREIATRQRSG